MPFSDQIHPKVIRQVLLLLLVFALGFLISKQMQYFLGAFMGAVAMYVLLRNLMAYLVYKRKWSRGLAATLLMVVSLVIIVLPLGWVVNVVIDAIKPMLQDTSGLEKSVDSIDNFLHRKYGVDVLSPDTMKKVTGFLAETGGRLLSATFSTVTNVFIMYFVLYFMLVNGREIEHWLLQNLPLKNSNSTRLLEEVHSVVLSNTIGIPVLGAIQGLVAMIGYSMFGIEQPILWGVITGISSVIPFVGTMAAWVPLTILTFANGHTSSGYWMLFWGLVVVGGCDNIFRFILQKYMADIHPLVTVFGVIIGLNLFGFLGLIFGPLLISLFFLLVRIYNDEFVNQPEDANANKQP
ncbi:MAG TPA: AI-2E family transporter [Phnomibacter sp.]|nr:AI-2E family transporter [Phnomibacter sp.]